MDSTHCTHDDFIFRESEARVAPESTPEKAAEPKKMTYAEITKSGMETVILC